MLSWRKRSLSFAGRLQLIKSVISGIINFWSQAFILPMGCLDEIESICSAFLWSGSPNQTHKAKVKWEDLCFPKSEGGLGLRCLRDSTRVFVLNLIWRLFTLPESLWVFWIQHYLLQDGSFWDVRDDTKGSWIWRKLLKMRPLAYQFFRFEIGNGRKAFFWFDDWLRVGKLIDITGAVGTRYLGVKRKARVCDAVLNLQWNVKGQRSRYFHALHDTIQNEPVPEPMRGEDVILWRHSNDDYHDSFSTTKTWNQIRQKRDEVSWSSSIWLAQGVPRYAFIAWLAVKNRLPTGDRMRTWGIIQECALCGERDETRDHLFFACPYAYTVWNRLARRIIGPRINPDWNDNLLILQGRRFTRTDQVLIRLLFQTTIYHIWRERNARRHQKRIQPVDKTIKLIDKAIRNRVSSLKYPGDQLGNLMRKIV